MFEAGPVGEGVVKIGLVDQGGTFETHFLAPRRQAREVLAIAVAAIPSKSTVFVDLPATTGDTEIHWMSMGALEGPS